jgi:hypothetical protein
MKRARQKQRGFAAAAAGKLAHLVKKRELPYYIWRASEIIERACQRETEKKLICLPACAQIRTILHDDVSLFYNNKAAGRRCQR